MLCQECRRAVFWTVIVLSVYTSDLYSILANVLIGYDVDSTLLSQLSVVQSPGVIVTGSRVPSVTSARLVSGVN